MKKVFFIPLLFLACSTHPNVEKSMQDINTENQIINKYQISKSALTKAGDEYIFFMPEAGGLGLYKLDKNYNLIQKQKIKGFIEGYKLLVHNNRLYLLGYDQNAQKPIILTLDKNLNVVKKEYIGDKFDIPRDFYIDKKPVVLLTTYKNGAKIKIISNTTKIINSKDNQQGKFIKPFNGGMLIIGSIQHPQEDLLLVFVKNGKIIWSKVYDFGLEDSPIKVKTDKDTAKIEVISQDYMGAQKYITITVDKEGNITSKHKDIEIKTLPLKFRT
ncbi:MAG: hypothetical protein GXO62_05705 [Epsilonproteobacteria bacterium]|nr:hypothetical protein [Campylobacterota bacterium]